MKIIAILIPLLLALSACGSKPPGCADPETLATVKTLLVDDTLKAMAEQTADDPEGWLQKFAQDMKVEVTGIVSDGYKADAKKQMCRGTLKVSMPTGSVAERSIDYSTQLTEDQKGAFLLEVQDVGPFVAATAQNAVAFYRANRWNGTWSGTYACSGVGGATEGPQGPYSMPVAMTVTGTEATLERTTLSGGIEKLKGRFDDSGLGKPFELSGEGENTPDDKWSTDFEGQVQGLKLEASGVIRVGFVDSSGVNAAFVVKVMRQCTLDLTLGR